MSALFGRVARLESVRRAAQPEDWALMGRVQLAFDAALGRHSLARLQGREPDPFDAALADASPHLDPFNGPALSDLQLTAISVLYEQEPMARFEAALERASQPHNPDEVGVGEVRTDPDRLADGHPVEVGAGRSSPGGALVGLRG